MLARLRCSLVLACSVLAAGQVFAQGGPLPGMYQTSPIPPTGHYLPGYHGSPGAPGPDAANCPPGIDEQLMTELLPADRGWFYDHPSPLDTALKDTSHGMWFRMDYMNVKIAEPGDTLLGAPLLNIPNPRDPFFIVSTTGAPLVARVMDTGPMSFENNNGIRGAFGIPLQMGEVEAVFWATEENTSRIRSNEIPQTNPLQLVNVIVTSLFVGGDLGDRVVIYDRSFEALYSVGVYDAEANFYYNYRNPRLGWRFKPLMGFRHMDYDERLNQRGEFDNSSGAARDPVTQVPFPVLQTPLLRQIDSIVDNSTYGAQFGFKSEFVHNHFVLGWEPKLTLGANHVEALVRTVDFRDSPFPPVQDDGTVVTRERKVQFAPIFDLNLYGKARLNDWFSVRLGWNFLWLGGISRAGDNIYYNDEGTANPPAVVVRTRDRGLWMSGLSIGGEILLP
jgi:hypothetical protein